MDLEVARADRHRDPVALARRPPRATGRPRTPRRRRAAGRAARAPARARAARAAAAVSSTRGHSSCSSRGGPGSATATHVPVSRTTAGAVPTSPTHSAPAGSAACLRTPCREVRVRTVQPLGDAARERLDLGRELLVDRERPAGGLREQLDRAVVVRRAEAARDDEQVLLEARPQRGFQLGRLVADDRDPNRIDAEAAAATRPDTGRSGPAGRRGRARSPTRRSPPLRGAANRSA